MLLEVGSGHITRSRVSLRWVWTTVEMELVEEFRVVLVGIESLKAGQAENKQLAPVALSILLVPECHYDLLEGA